MLNLKYHKNRFKVLGYDKQKIVPNSMKSHHNVFKKNPKSQ